MNLIIVESTNLLSHDSFFFLGDILNLKSYTSISQKLTLITREEDDSTFKNTICVLDVVAEITETTSNL